MPFEMRHLAPSAPTALNLLHHLMALYIDLIPFALGLVVGGAWAAFLIAYGSNKVESYLLGRRMCRAQRNTASGR
jgi:hypothetical protein